MSKLKEGFAVLFKCKEAKASDGSIMTEEGNPAWLTEDDGYWWGKPFSEFYSPKVSRTSLPHDVIVFKTREEAERQFKEARKGNHIGPWYYRPGKEFEIIEIRQKFKTVPDGYEEVK